jgi:hypothetical protein
MLRVSAAGKTDYVIVLPVEPTPVERTAAKELKEHLDSITGADFVVVKESEADPARPQIVVGNSKRSKQLLPKLDVTKLPYDGIIIKCVGTNLILLGHPKRGTLYAVNTFLEDGVGVRWWTSTESFIPKRPTLEIPVLNIEYAPKLIYREAYYRDAREGVFATRMKCNGAMIYTTPEYGDHHRFQYFVHSFYALLPPKQYFAGHPDWYSEINGKRQGSSAQLCLTNSGMLNELTKNAIEALRKNPEALFISISQNDCGNYCQCRNCTAIADKEGSQAGPLIHFLNAAAEIIGREFPHVWVETLAYQWSRKPPQLVKPRPNVIIRFCTISCAFSEPFKEGEQNKALREDIEGWCKLTNHLFAWDYVTNFTSYLLPHPNIRVLASNIRFFVDHQALGMYENGDAYSAGGDFVRMRNWVISHLMWNPALDEKKLFDDFFEGYYGADAGPIVKEYWSLLLDQAERSGVYLGCFRNSTNDWLDSDGLIRANALMNTAVEMAKDETLRNRLRRDKIPIDFVMLKEYHALRRKAELTGVTFPGMGNPQGLLDDFFARCREFDVTVYRLPSDAQKWEVFEERLRRRCTISPTPVPDFCRNLPKNQWYEVQSFEFNLALGWQFVLDFGKWAFLVDDDKASTGMTVKIPGNHWDWKMFYHFDDLLVDLKSPQTQTAREPTYRIYGSVRCEATAREGPTIILGVHDQKAKKIIVDKRIPVSEVSASEYRWIDIGSVALKPGRNNFWFAPPKRPGEVDAVYLDRIIVVRE